MTMITNLGGHSRCLVQLHEKENDTIFVRKISSGLDYNDRLKEQMRKQMVFRGKFLKSPSVFGSGYMDNGLFYFDMEYIQGMTMAKYITSVEIDRIRQIVLTLSADIINLNDDRGVQPIKHFKRK